MNWRRFLAALAVLTIIVIAVGALANLPAIILTQPIAATIILLTGLVLLTILVAKHTRSNPYW